MRRIVHCNRCRRELWVKDGPMLARDNEGCFMCDNWNPESLAMGAAVQMDKGKDKPMISSGGYISVDPVEAIVSNAKDIRGMTLPVDKSDEQERPREPLVGWMILEDHADDLSHWDGVIAFPNPTGANLAWESPTKMIEFSAFEAEKKRADKWEKIAQRNGGAYEDCVKERCELKAEVERLKEVIKHDTDKIGGAYEAELSTLRSQLEATRNEMDKLRVAIVKETVPLCDYQKAVASLEELKSYLPKVPTQAYEKELAQRLSAAEERVRELEKLTDSFQK